MSPQSPIQLSVQGLEVAFGGARSPASRLAVLRGVSFEVRRGECLGLVGESGCGKSMTALAVMGLLPRGGRILGGTIELAGVGELTAMGERQRRRCRGRQLAMVFQEPSAALNPLFSIGFQIRESLRFHRGLRGRAARRASLELLERVAMPDPTQRLESYPHELSGGQCQRAMIALALASEPQLLLADEPTTALDVTVQAQILDLLASLRRELGLTVVLITHDLGVIAQSCDRVAVMYAGQVVERAPTAVLFGRPGHPYTRALLDVLPRLGGEPRRLGAGIAGQVPELGAVPPGCSFHPRCGDAQPRCSASEPPWIELDRVPSDSVPSDSVPSDSGPSDSTQSVRCWLHDTSSAKENR